MRRTAANVPTVALLILDPTAGRIIDDVAIGEQITYPLRRHLDVASDRRAQGGRAGAASAMSALVDLVEGPRGQRWIESDVRTTLLTHAGAYLDTQR